MSRSMWKPGRHRLVNRPSCSIPSSGAQFLLVGIHALTQYKVAGYPYDARRLCAKTIFTTKITNAWTHKCEPAPILMP